MYLGNPIVLTVTWTLATDGTGGNWSMSIDAILGNCANVPVGALGYSWEGDTFTVSPGTAVEGAFAGILYPQGALELAPIYWTASPIPPPSSPF